MNIARPSIGAMLLILVSLTTGSGCFIAAQGPTLGPFGIPIPISPYFQKEKEDKYFEHEHYERVPILGPLTKDGPVTALDPPSDDQIMRALERAHPLQGGFPMLHEVQRNNVKIVKEKIGDYIDPPRVIPLIGPAQLHHCNYKCTIYYSETTHVGWPLPRTLVNEDAQEVIYVDHTHFHMVGNVDTGPTANY